MKRIIKITALLCIAAMALTLAACGGSKPAETTAAAPQETAAPAETEAASEETTAAEAAATEAPAAASADVSSPSITIEYGDAAAIEDLAKKAQNFEVAEGTVVKISGIFSTGISTPAVQEKTDDGAVGINLYVDGDWEMPGDGVDIEVVGSFVKGQYFMEFHATPDNITVK